MINVQQICSYSIPRSRTICNSSHRRLAMSSKKQKNTSMFDSSNPSPRTVSTLPEKLFSRMAVLLCSISSAFMLPKNTSDYCYRLVLETLDPLPGDRKCFRMVNGILVERTVKDVIPALQTNSDGLKKVLDDLVKQYKKQQDDMEKWKVKLTSLASNSIYLTDRLCRRRIMCKSCSNKVQRSIACRIVSFCCIQEPLQSNRSWSRFDLPINALMETDLRGHSSIASSELRYMEPTVWVLTRYCTCILESMLNVKVRLNIVRTKTGYTP